MRRQASGLPFRSCRSGPTYVKNFSAQAVRRQASGLPFRSCRSGPTYVKKLSAQAGRTQAKEWPYLKLSVRASFSRPYVSEIYGRFHFWNEIPWSPTFLLFRKKNGKSTKEENTAPSLRPEKLAGHYPTRNSLPTVAQTGAPADATSQFFSLRAPASVQRGGELHQCLSVSCILANAHPA